MRHSGGMDYDKKFKQLFLIACARGSVTEARQFLAKGVAASSTDKEGRSGAHLAASRGDLATLRLMHSVGANLVAADNAGRTPLHNAAVKDCTSAITYLVHKGAYVDVCDASGCSPLHVAARSGAAGACSRLLDLGAAAQLCSNRELTALGEAVTRGHVKVCRVLASAGAARADVLSQRINGGFTLLHLAAGAGAAATVQWLLERTAAKSLNDGENEEGLTPLHCCVLGGNLNYATVDMLVTCGANVADMDASGKTALDILDRPHEYPNLSNNLALLPMLLVDNIKQRLVRSQSCHPGTLRAGMQHSDLTAMAQSQLVGS